MTDSKLLDSSIWIDYIANGRHKGVIDGSSQLFLASISLIEIKKKLHNLGLNSGQIAEKLDFVKKRSIIVILDEALAEKAATLSEENNLGAADAIIYASALLNKDELLTLDNDFRRLKGTRVF